MEIIIIRHVPCTRHEHGEPAKEWTELFLETAKKVTNGMEIVITTGVKRTDDLGKLLSKELKLHLVVTKKLGPIRMLPLFPFFGGGFFHHFLELLQRSSFWNQLIISLWSTGLLLFLEPPDKYRKRIEKEFERIRRLGQEKILIIGHQELFIAAEAIKEKSSINKIKKEVEHLELEVVKL